MNINNIEAQIDEKFGKNENTSKFERFLIKKYKCFIILIMSILSISEMIYGALERLAVPSLAVSRSRSARNE
jgi:hypothetical protein